VVKIFPPPMFQQRRDSEVSRPENAAGNPVRAAVLALGQPAQLHRVRLPRLHRSTDRLVRRTASQVLRVKRPEGGPDRRADPHDAFCHVWPKKGNPKIAAEKQLRAAHRGWASRTLHAIVLHLLHGRRCIIHHSTSARRITAFIHLPLQTREFARLDVNFLAHRSSREIGFSPIRESTSSPIVRFIERKVLSKP
jgi:hypothetical protein